MDRKRIAILGILVLIVASIAIMVPKLAGQLAGTGPAPSQGTSIESVLDLGDFDIDPGFSRATPHWVLIVAGRKDQAVIIGFIENTSASGEKKAAWEATLRQIWATYPIKAVPSAQGGMITCDCDISLLRLTGSQEATLREVENEIGLAMQKSLEETTTTLAGGK